MRKLFVLIFVAGLLGLFGCKPGNAIVGEWNGSQPSSSGGTTDINAVFNGDGTFVFKMGSGETGTQTSGTYVYNDTAKTLTLTPKKTMRDGRESDAPDAPAGGAPATPVTWKGNDLTITLPDGEITMKRKT